MYKCLIVDDEIKDFRTRQIFLQELTINKECVLFASSYDEAISIIEKNENIAFCFLDCRIPKNSHPPYEYGDLTDISSEWGFKLISHLKKQQVHFYSAYLAQNRIAEKIKNQANVVTFSEKPFSNLVLQNLKTQYLAKLFPETTEKSNITNNANPTFNYNSLDAEVADFVREKTASLKLLARKTAQQIITIGEYLHQIKDKLGHGNFENWLKAEFTWSLRTANRFMRIASSFKEVDFDNLNIYPTVLYRLTEKSIPKVAREEAIQRAIEGENISKKDINRIIQKHQANPSISQPNDKDKSQSISSPAKSIQNTQKLEIISVQHHNIARNSYWKLGENNRLFCGDPNDPLFTNKINEPVSLTINFPKIDNLKFAPPIKANSNITIQSIYEDINLSEIEKIITSSIYELTMPDEIIVFSHIFHPNILNLANQYKCKFYAAEPNLEMCKKVLDNWRKKDSVMRIEQYIT